MNKTIIVLLITLFAWPTIADDAQMQAEIDHLINYIRNSTCKFIRNGKAHSSDEAIDHILRKYEHFKDKIKTSEDFIDYCASKSLLSDQPYQIKCPGQTVIESRLWFLEELKRFRRR